MRPSRTTRSALWAAVLAAGALAAPVAAVVPASAAASTVATNQNWDGYLAPGSGNFVSIGFVANQNGACPSPAG
jgi:hypothetical protein